MTTGDTLRPALRRVLTQGAGTRTDAHAVAAAALRAYERLAQELAPVIGEAGLNAVCARSVHLTQREFSWLPAADPPRPRGAPVAPVRLALWRQGPGVEIAPAVPLLPTRGAGLASVCCWLLTTRLLV